MENTVQLRSWISERVESHFDGNLTAFSDRTRVSRQTWMNILNNKYRSLRQQAISDLCNLFNLTELDLYLVAHPNAKAEAKAKESPASGTIKDDAERLANYLRKTSEEDSEFIYAAAERCGFKRLNK